MINPDSAFLEPVKILLEGLNIEILIMLRLFHILLTLPEPVIDFERLEGLPL